MEDNQDNKENIKYRFNPSSTRSEKVLGPLEGAIMDVIWENGPSTVSAVHKALREKKGRDMAYTTVMTTMSRLAQKRVLLQDRSSTTYVYSPVLDRSAFERYVVKGIISSLLDDYGDEVVDTFVEAVNEMGEDKAQRLRSALDGTGAAAQAS